MQGSSLGFLPQDVATRSNDLSSVLSTTKKSTSEAWNFCAVIECKRHRSFHNIDDTSSDQSDCLFEKRNEIFTLRCSTD